MVTHVMRNGKNILKTGFFLSLFVSLCVSCFGPRHVVSHSFLKRDTNYIMSEDSLRPMRIFKISTVEDSLILRKKSSNVKIIPNDPVLKYFIKRLYVTVTDSSNMGVGIAAPQVGILKNIIWVQRFDKDDFPFEVYLNPKIITYSEQKQTFREGCLSIPDRSETLNTRAFSIDIEYNTIEGDHNTETVEGFTSVIFQHEIDHLNGILYVDHLEKERLDTSP